MKSILLLAATSFAFVACDSRVTTAPPDKVVEKDTTIINHPAKEEKKVENHTTIVNPPPKEEKKVESHTTIINPPATPPAAPPAR